MTQYSSREPFNDDPEPWLFISDQVFGVIRSARNKGYHDVSGTYWVHRPRPEFDRPQTNPTNPVLVDFRSIYHETTPTIYQGYWELAEIWLELLDLDPAMADPRNWGALVNEVTGHQVDHARRVLTHLASLKEES